MKNLFKKKMICIYDLTSQELQNTNGGTTCPSMGDYYSAGLGGFYVRSFWKGFINGFASHF